MVSAFTPWLNMYVMSMCSRIALQGDVLHTICASYWYTVACYRTGFPHLLMLCRAIKTIDSSHLHAEGHPSETQEIHWPRHIAYFRVHIIVYNVSCEDQLVVSGLPASGQTPET